MSQRITGNLQWTNSMIVYCCQMGVCILRWEGRGRTQTVTLLAAHSSCWGPQCMCEDTIWHELTVDICQTVEWDRYCNQQPQNIDKESKNAENLATESTKQSDRGTHVAMQGNHQIASEVESLIHWILTVCEKWAHLYEPELKRQSTECHHLASTCRQKYQQEQGQP